MSVKVVTICGSRRFEKEIMEVRHKLADELMVVLLPEFDRDNIRDVDALKLQFTKISMSDAIYVVDVDGYVGEGTKAEIAFASMNGKSIKYYSEDVQFKEWLKKPVPSKNIRTLWPAKHERNI